MFLWSTAGQKNRAKKLARLRHLRTCVLVRKQRDKSHEIDIDYLGFDIPDKWVVGYGLDYDEQHRTLPYIGALS